MQNFSLSVVQVWLHHLPHDIKIFFRSPYPQYLRNQTPKISIKFIKPKKGYAKKCMGRGFLALPPPPDKIGLNAFTRSGSSFLTSLKYSIVFISVLYPLGCFSISP